jgi:hypothetical protein
MTSTAQGRDLAQDILQHGVANSLASQEQATGVLVCPPLPTPIPRLPKCRRGVAMLTSLRQGCPDPSVYTPPDHAQAASQPMQGSIVGASNQADSCGVGMRSPAPKESQQSKPTTNILAKALHPRSRGARMLSQNIPVQVLISGCSPLAQVLESAVRAAVGSAVACEYQNTPGTCRQQNACTCKGDVGTDAHAMCRVLTEAEPAHDSPEAPNLGADVSSTTVFGSLSPPALIIPSPEAGRGLDQCSPADATGQIGTVLTQQPRSPLACSRTQDEIDNMNCISTQSCRAYADKRQKVVQPGSRTMPLPLAFKGLTEVSAECEKTSVALNCTHLATIANAKTKDFVMEEEKVAWEQASCGTDECTESSRECSPDAPHLAEAPLHDPAKHTVSFAMSSPAHYFCAVPPDDRDADSLCMTPARPEDAGGSCTIGLEHGAAFPQQSECKKSTPSPLQHQCCSPLALPASADKDAVMHAGDCGKTACETDTGGPAQSHKVTTAIVGTVQNGEGFSGGGERSHMLSEPCVTELLHDGVNRGNEGGIAGSCVTPRNLKDVLDDSADPPGDALPPIRHGASTRCADRGIPHEFGAASSPQPAQEALIHGEIDLPHAVTPTEGTPEEDFESSVRSTDSATLRTLQRTRGRDSPPGMSAPQAAEEIDADGCPTAGSSPSLRQLCSGTVAWGSAEGVPSTSNLRLDADVLSKTPVIRADSAVAHATQPPDATDVNRSPMVGTLPLHESACRACKSRSSNVHGATALPLAATYHETDMMDANALKPAFEARHAHATAVQGKVWDRSIATSLTPVTTCDCTCTTNGSGRPTACSLPCAVQKEPTACAVHTVHVAAAQPGLPNSAMCSTDERGCETGSAELCHEDVSGCGNAAAMRDVQCAPCEEESSSPLGSVLEDELAMPHDNKQASAWASVDGSALLTGHDVTSREPRKMAVAVLTQHHVSTTTAEGVTTEHAAAERNENDALAGVEHGDLAGSILGKPWQGVHTCCARERTMSSGSCLVSPSEAVASTKASIICAALCADKEIANDKVEDLPLYVVARATGLLPANEVATQLSVSPPHSNKPETSTFDGEATPTDIELDPTDGNGSAPAGSSPQADCAAGATAAAAQGPTMSVAVAPADRQTACSTAVAARGSEGGKKVPTKGSLAGNTGGKPLDAIEGSVDAKDTPCQNARMLGAGMYQTACMDAADAEPPKGTERAPIAAPPSRISGNDSDANEMLLRPLEECFHVGECSTPPLQRRPALPPSPTVTAAEDDKPPSPTAVAGNDTPPSTPPCRYASPRFAVHLYQSPRPPCAASFSEVLMHTDNLGDGSPIQLDLSSDSQAGHDQALQLAKLGQQHDRLPHLLHDLQQPLPTEGPCLCSLSPGPRSAVGHCNEVDPQCISSLVSCSGSLLTFLDDGACPVSPSFRVLDSAASGVACLSPCNSVRCASPNLLPNASCQRTSDHLKSLLLDSPPCGKGAFHRLPSLSPLKRTHISPMRKLTAEMQLLPGHIGSMPWHAPATFISSPQLQTTPPGERTHGFSADASATVAESPPEGRPFAQVRYR